MLRVETYLGMSALHGIGLFAARDIQAGELIWCMDEGFDHVLSAQAIEALPEVPRRAMQRYTYRVAEGYVLCEDDARFMNHADDPNVDERQDEQGRAINVAARAIMRGEELTVDYRVFDPEAYARLR